LKTDVKLTLDRRAKKKEVVVVVSQGPEQEKSGKSHRHLTVLDNMNQNISGDEENGDVSKNEFSELSLGKGRGTATAGIPEGSSADDTDDRARARRRRHLFSKLKAASTSKINSLHRNQVS